MRVSQSMSNSQLIAAAMLAIFGDGAEQQAIALARQSILERDKIAAKAWGDILQVIGRLREGAPDTKHLV